jgi:hypothetical protein
MQEDFHLVQSADHYGVTTEMMIEDGNFISKQTYDAAPMIEAAAAARVANEGKRWGDGQFVGVIPMPELQRINQKYQGAEERKHAILTWLRDNPKLVTFDKFLK